MIQEYINRLSIMLALVSFVFMTPQLIFMIPKLNQFIESTITRMNENNKGISSGKPRFKIWNVSLAFFIAVCLMVIFYNGYKLSAGDFLSLIILLMTLAYLFSIVYPRFNQAIERIIAQLHDDKTLKERWLVFGAILCIVSFMLQLISTF